MRIRHPLLTHIAENIKKNLKDGYIVRVIQPNVDRDLVEVFVYENKDGSSVPMPDDSLVKSMKIDLADATANIKGRVAGNSRMAAFSPWDLAENMINNNEDMSGIADSAVDSACAKLGKVARVSA